MGNCNKSLYKIQNTVNYAIGVLKKSLTPIMKQRLSFSA